MSFRACQFKWDEDALSMRLNPRFRRVALEQFRNGEEYRLTEEEERSSKHRAYYFAQVREAWQNLRGETAEILSSPNLLRGWCLVESGWCDQHIIDVPDKATALKTAVFARAVSSKETYSEVKVLKHDGSWYVRIRTPRSQSRVAMTAAELKQSFADVLAILAGTIEVTRRDLAAAGKRNAV